MRRPLQLVLLGVLVGSAAAFAQIQQPNNMRPLTWSIRGEVPPASRTNWLVESFGYNLSPVALGFEFPMRLTEGILTPHGLECPLCIVRPTGDRSRFTLPEFGATVTKSFWNGRSQIFAQFGGVNMWKPENSIIGLSHSSFSPRNSSNDAWLLQGSVGGRVALDRTRRIWLGGVGRYLENFSGEGKKHWNSLGGTATFVFGR